MNALPSITVFGIPYVVADLPTAGQHLAALAAATTEPKLVAHSDVHVLTRMLHEKEYGEGMMRFHYICPDGMPIVWLMRRKGVEAHRLYGPDMMETVWDCGRPHGLRHYLLGGSEQAVEQLRTKFAGRFPGVQIVGHYCPPMGQWPEGENEAIARRIAESGANCVWVALGCPKQERWLYTNLPQLPPALYFGVGAAFNFHAGLVSQAPRWVRSHGLEWLYRLCCEPRRLFKRYLVHNSRFLWYWLTRKV
ncbi:MAG: WecB/TagA/CpsF family glycosyltransferase [Akkermansia sp.]|nr:WecB/TagA/CpsF family glycosyltransferase [Akkermansia sp.]